MDVDKKPLEPEEVQAVTSCSEQVDVATTACAAEGSSGEVVPTAVCVKTKVHICPILKDWIVDFAGVNRERKQWSMAHSLRVANRLCPLFENIHDDAPRKWKYSSATSLSRLGRLPLLKPFHVTRLSKVVEEASSQLCMESRMYQLLMHETLSAMDCDARPSERWTRQFFLTLAMTMSPEVFTFLAQVIHKGKTSAVLPPRPWREGVLHTIAANSWQHTEGIIDFVAFIDERFNPEGAASPDAKVPWLLVWDLASIHTSEATRTTLTEKFPWVSLCYILANSTGYNQPLDARCVQGLQEQRFMAGDIAWKRSSLAEWVYAAMREMSTKPALWIHAWRHLMTASEEERKVNVDRAKRAFTNNTLFAPTHHGTVPETAATCEDSMAPEDDHPEIELMHEGEAEEAEADEDVEDIVMEVPDQPTASASSSSAASAKKVHSTRAMHCAQSRLRHGTACLIFSVL